jgi:hypothetical protein
MVRKLKPKTKVAAKKSKAVPHELIAKRAYEKFLKRGSQHGRHAQDWLEAERELKSEWSEE